MCSVGPVCLQPFTFLPMALAGLTQVLVALKRIGDFLCLPEINEKQREKLDRVGVEMTDAQFTWREEEKREEDAKKEDAAGGKKEEANGKPAVPKPEPEKPEQKEAPVSSADGVAAPIKTVPPRLTHVNLSIQPGDLALVLGPVGFG